MPSGSNGDLGDKPKGLPTRAWLIVGKVFEGKGPRAIAAELGQAERTVVRTMSDPAFKAVIAQVQQGILDRITRGEFGILARAKQEASAALDRLIELSKQDKDARVALQANVKILELAGIQAPKPDVTPSPERLIDQMTAEEATLFAETGRFPERFAPQLARLASSVLDKAGQKKLDVEVVDGHVE